VPRLTQILSPEDERKYRSEIDGALEGARSALTSSSGRTLTPTQAAVAQQLRGMIRQVESLRATDLVSAQRLAERARILATDLSRSLR
jgi:hypothetical protein